ncbi:hypothetical protein TSUD_277500 [Trifolium subterraneum]|uniref:RNase H type-1 domain-containing protein n=1 Tax=Trifolium subterraneum TaxID=3900 RepID=A0A2Z6MV70_TRISU|nr:hypothetical protein TSUD_277500 [Trifolium subterraneum]
MSWLWGLIRDSLGRWVIGFAKFLGQTNAYMAELWGLFHGLRIARSQGIGKLIVQSDSVVIVKSLQTGSEGSATGWMLFKKIKQLLTLNWEVRIIHVYREANSCADIMAGQGCSLQGDEEIYSNPPTVVLQCVSNDARGVSFPRLVSS